jgi:hypothetical protein
MGTMKKKNPHAQAVGRLSLEKHSVDFYRKKGRLGGAPRRYPECPAYKKSERKTHQFNPATDICYGCGFNRKTRLFPKGENKANA